MAMSKSGTMPTMPVWTKEWPKEQGTYWFYGYCFGNKPYLGKVEDPELCFVEVWHDGQKNPMYVTKEHFLYASEGATGKWLKADLPTLPTLE